jgi:hypothetical protein
MSAALPAFGGERVIHAPVTLYTSFEQAPPAAVLEALASEVEVLMAPLGMQFSWRSLSTARGNEVSAELAVVTFKGRCDVAGLLPHTAPAGALGWTHVSDGVILPFSDVDCDRIRLFLQRDLLLLKPEHRVEAFGRAVGRVISHELYHIFAQTAHHAADGVAKSAYTVHELLSGEFQFDTHESLTLRGSTGRPAATEKPVGTP